MRGFVLCCHPVDTSLATTLHQEEQKGLKASGHEVGDCDLYAEGFKPVMSREDRLGHHDVPACLAPLRDHIDRLRHVQALR